MNNPDRVRIWTNLWNTVQHAWHLYFEPLRIVYRLKWWFKFGDLIMDKATGDHNAGNFKFRKNMIIIWFVFWASWITIVPDSYELLPLVAVLWGAFVWTRD